MSDEKKDIRFKKAFMGGFQRQSVAEYIEGLQKELFESRAAAAKAVKDFEEYHVKESIRQQRVAFEADENLMLRKELEDVKLKLAAAQAQADKASVSPEPADTSAIEAELARERAVSESLRLDVAELKKQLSEEYSANELLAAAVGGKDSEIAALNEKLAAAVAVAVSTDTTEAAQTAAAETESIRSEAAAQIEAIKAAASDETEKVRAEAFVEIERVKAEAAAELEKAEAEANRLKAELEQTEQLLNEAREQAEAAAIAAYKPVPVAEETAEASEFEQADTADTDGVFAVVETVPTEETPWQELSVGTLPGQAEDDLPVLEEAEEAVTDIFTQAHTEYQPEAAESEEIQEVTSSEADDTAVAAIEDILPTQTQPEDGAVVREPVGSNEPVAAPAEEPVPVAYEAPKAASQESPKVYDKEKIADIIARYTNIRKQSENK